MKQATLILFLVLLFFASCGHVPGPFGNDGSDQSQDEDFVLKINNKINPADGFVTVLDINKICKVFTKEGKLLWGDRAETSFQVYGGFNEKNVHIVFIKNGAYNSLFINGTNVKLQNVISGDVKIVVSNSLIIVKYMKENSFELIKLK